MGVRIPPIPKIALQHSVVVIDNAGNSATDFETSNPTEHEFRCVRVEASDTTTDRKLNNVSISEFTGTYTLFIDAVNSINADDYEIKRNDVVRFDDEERKVLTIDKEYALGTKFHHLEVTLQ